MNDCPKLMVVDDEVDVCNFVKSFFGMRGFEVAMAFSGEDALGRLSEERPDVMILDVMMHGWKEGLEYLPKIKERLPSVKVIMVTGVDDEESVRLAKSLGADGYVTKPLVLEYLEGTVLEKVKNLKRESSHL
ncbi:MAG: response regulator [Candidatus Omnitrophica bacterium]|nr:response regulator [Candidatus Omnitrophota bacterium]